MSKLPITIYHNPRCSKSRQTLQLLRDANLEPTIVDYLKTPPSANDLDLLCTALGGDPTVMFRFKEPQAKTLGISPDDIRVRADWIELLAANPQLLERPIVLRGERAVIGRPPENVRELL